GSTDPRRGRARQRSAAPGLEPAFRYRRSSRSLRRRRRTRSQPKKSRPVALVRPFERLSGFGGSGDFAFHIEKAPEFSECVDVGDHDALAVDLEVAVGAELLDVSLHGVDVESDPG